MRGRSKTGRQAMVWINSNGGKCFPYDGGSAYMYRSKATIDSNGVFILNYFIKTPLAVNSRASYHILLNKFKALYGKYEDADKRLLVIEPLSKRNGTYTTNIQYIFITNGMPSVEDMCAVEQLIKDNALYYSDEEFDAVVRQKYCDSAKKSMASKKTDAYCD